MTKRKSRSVELGNKDTPSSPAQIPKRKVQINSLASLPNNVIEVMEIASTTWQELSATKQIQWEEKAKEDVTRYHREKRFLGRSNKKLQHNFNTSCCTSKFIRLVGQLSDDQTKAISDTPLKPLLLLSLENVPSDFSFWLVSHFRPSHRRLDVDENVFLQCSVDEVSFLMGLPSTGCSPNSISTKETEELIVLKQLLGFSGVAMKVTMLEKILPTLGHGTIFVQAFVLYAIATIIAPDTSGTISSDLFNLVRDIWTINSLNWAELLIESLVVGVEKMLASNVLKPYDTFPGCLLFLQLLYLDRVDVGYSVNKSQLSLSFWTEKRVNERLTMERMDCGGYGSAKKISQRHTVVDEEVVVDVVEAFPQMPTTPNDAAEIPAFMELLREYASSLVQREASVTTHERLVAERERFLGMTSVHVLDSSMSPSKEAHFKEVIEINPLHVARPRHTLNQTVRIPAFLRSPFTVELKKHPHISEQDIRILDLVATSSNSSEILPLDELVIDIYGYGLTPHNLRCLVDKNWVSNITISFFSRLLTLRSKCNIYLETGLSDLLSTIPQFKKISHNERASLLTYFGKSNLPFSPLLLKRIFIPLLRNNHWCLFCMDFDSRRIEYLDSQPREARGVGFIARLLADIANGLVMPEYGLQGQQFSYQMFRVDVPLQDNSYDCGVFLIKFMQLWDGRSVPSLDPKKMEYQRARLIVDTVLDNDNKYASYLLNLAKDDAN